MRLPRARAVAFDLDGTLVDSKLDIAAACNFALQSVGRAALDVEQIAALVGDGARALVSRALAAPPDDAETERALVSFHRYYEDHPADFTTLMPGALEALDAMEGRAAVLVTNKPRGPTVAVLAALKIGGRFAVVRTGSDGPLKPDPRAVTDALAPLGVPAPEAWMVGDGAQDVQAGRRAGCKTVGLLGGIQGSARLLDSGPDLVVESLVDLAALLR